MGKEDDGKKERKEVNKFLVAKTIIILKKIYRVKKSSKTRRKLNVKNDNLWW